MEAKALGTLTKIKDAENILAKGCMPILINPKVATSIHHCKILHLTATTLRIAMRSFCSSRLCFQYYGNEFSEHFNVEAVAFGLESKMHGNGR